MVIKKCEALVQFYWNQVPCFILISYFDICYLQEIRNARSRKYCCIGEMIWQRRTEHQGFLSRYMLLLFLRVSSLISLKNKPNLKKSHCHFAFLLHRYSKSLIVGLVCEILSYPFKIVLKTSKHSTHVSKKLQFLFKTLCFAICSSGVSSRCLVMIIMEIFKFWWSL